MYPVDKRRTLATNDECSSETQQIVPNELSYSTWEASGHFGVLILEHTPDIPTHGSGGCPYSQTVPW